MTAKNIKQARIMANAHYRNIFHHDVRLGGVYITGECGCGETPAVHFKPYGMNYMGTKGIIINICKYCSL